MAAIRRSGEKIEEGSWQDIAKEALANDPEKYRLTNLKEHIDFALPILHGPMVKMELSRAYLR